MNDDGELLRQFAAKKDEASFAQLVQRYLGFVYAVSLRRLRDHHAAQDAAQAVFVALARKAESVAQGPSVIGWLHRSACYETNNLMRARANQLARETEALRLGTTTPESRQDLKVLSVILDEALLKLSDTDREAILARYFSGWSYSQVGAALQLSENAARMRVDRAILKLREHLSLRGFTSTAVLLAEAMPTFASAAPPSALAASITQAAMAGIAASTGTIATFIESMSITKLVAGLVLAASASGAVYEYQQVAALKRSLAHAQAATTASNLRLHKANAEIDQLQRASTSGDTSATSSSVKSAKAAASGVIPNPPKGWYKNGSAPKLYEVGVDQDNSWGGMASAYAKSTGDAEGKFGGMMQTISADAYRGQRVRLTGWIKTQDVTGSGDLWMRIDGQDPNHHLALDNMLGRAPSGTTDWQDYSIVLDVPATATGLAYGFFVAGNGQMWVNGVTLTVVGPEVPSTAQLEARPSLPSSPTNLGFALPAKN